MKHRYLIFFIISMLFLTSCSLASTQNKDTQDGQLPLNPVTEEEKNKIEILNNNTANIKSLKEITPENANNIMEIMSFGSGLIHDISYSADGSSIIVSTSIGIFIYESGTLKQEHFFQTETSMGTIAVSPDNRTIAVSSGSFGIDFFDMKSKTYLGKISYIDQTIYGFAFVNNGKEIVTAETNKSVHYWDVATLTHTQSVSLNLTWTISFAASADGKLLAIETDEDHLIHILDRESGMELSTLSKPDNFTKISMAFSPDNRTLIAGSWSQLFVWNIENGEMLNDLSSNYENGSLFFISFSTQGDNFMVFSSEKVDLWDSVNYNLIATIPFNLDSATLCAASTRDNQSVVVGTLDGTITTYEVTSGQKIGSAMHHVGVFTSVAIAPDANLIAAGDILGRIFVWDLESKSLKFLLEEHREEVKKLVFSPDGKNLVSLSEEEMIFIWDMSSGLVKDRLFGFTEEIETIDFSPDGKILAAAGFNDKIFLLDTQNGTVIRTINEGGDVSLNFSPDGTTLVATDSDDDLTVWTIDGELLYHDRKETGMFGSAVLHFGKDNVLWAAAEVDDVGISIWTPLLEKKIEVLIPPNNISKEGFKFSPSSQILAYYSGIGIHLINASTGKKILELVPVKPSDFPPYNFISSFEFSENGKLLAVASEGGTVSIWGIQ